MQHEMPQLTRRDLVGLGISRYQSTAITKGIPAVGKKGNSNIYSLSDVLEALRAYLSRRIKRETRATVERAVAHLQIMLGNVIEQNFSDDGDPHIKRSLNQLKRAMANTDKSMARLKTRRKRLETEFGAPV